MNTGKNDRSRTTEVNSPIHSADWRLSAPPRTGWFPSLDQSQPRGLWVAWGLVLFAAVWLTHLSLTNLTPPIDNIEQLNWVRSLQWGYYKHPPLPTWLIWLPTRFFGANAWTSYVTGAVCTLGAIGLLWCLLARLRGQVYATVAMLAVLCITYYNARLFLYNHNTVLALLSTLCAVLCWKACTGTRQGWWVALGVALGLGLMAKYQFAVTLACVLVFWLTQRGWRQTHQRRGLLLATLIALLMFLPHLHWLRTHDYGPVQYALGSSLTAHLDMAHRLGAVVRWLVDQLLNRALPAWLLLAVGVLALRGLPVQRIRSEAMAPRRGAGRDLLLCWGFVPLMFVPLMVLFTGANPQMHWGSPFLLFAVPAMMELASGRIAWRHVPLGGMLKIFVLIQLVLIALGQVTAATEREPLRARNWHNFDSGKLAKAVEAPALEALSGSSICVVSGPFEMAGALALHLANRPLVLIDGRYDISPWVVADRLKGCGLLQLLHGPVPPGATLAGPSFPGWSWRVVPP